ncbi:MAG: hydantoinase/oxoprolinase family protein [Gemmatimonadaceae bacterium]
MTRIADAVLGWDIGGVNTKVARVAAGVVLGARSEPFEIQRAPSELAPLLARLATEVGGAPLDTHAVTMTAELSQHFRTKREGVHFVLGAVEAAFPGAAVYVYAVDGCFLDLSAARREPLAVAASNWAATARLAARTIPDAILIDVGTTTTDVIPLVGGEVAARGRTDPERLREGELLYLGALRTPVEAIVHAVPLGGGLAGVSAEGFALAGDAHLWRGELHPAAYTAPTPDGRAATREGAGERLARVVCGDREMLDDAAITAIADCIADAQVARIAEAIARVGRRHPHIALAVTTGLGEFLAAIAARRAGLQVAPLAPALGLAPAQCAAAAAVALLLAGAPTA